MHLHGVHTHFTVTSRIYVVTTHNQTSRPISLLCVGFKIFSGVKAEIVLLCAVALGYWSPGLSWNRFFYLKVDCSVFLLSVRFNSWLFFLPAHLLHVSSQTVWSRVFSEKLTRPKLLKKFTVFYGTQGSLPHLQESATCPYPEPDWSSLCSLTQLQSDPS